MTTTLRKALERLSAAALARDSTMGDPCALLAAKAELADANKAACAALAAPQPEPVAYVPRCHTDGNYCIVGEYKWDEIEEKPFGLADPAHWECAALYAAPPAAPAPAVPDDAALNTLAKLFHNGEEIEGDNGAAMMVDMALWHEASEAFDSLIGEGDDETLASSAAPAVPLTDEQINDIWNAKDLPEHRSHLSPWGMDRIRAIIAAAQGGGK